MTTLFLASKLPNLSFYCHWKSLTLRNTHLRLDLTKYRETSRLKQESLLLIKKTCSTHEDDEMNVCVDESGLKEKRRSIHS